MKNEELFNRAQHGSKINNMENENIEEIDYRINEIKKKLKILEKEFKTARGEGASRNTYLQQRELWHHLDSLIEHKNQLISKEEIPSVNPSGEPYSAQRGSKINPAKYYELDGFVKCEHCGSSEK